MEQLIGQTHKSWNKGRIIGQKPPLKLREIWSIRTHLQMDKSARDLALFNLAIDSKLRGCDLVKLKVSDIAHGKQILNRTTILQQKTKNPVQFEITEATRKTLKTWIEKTKLFSNDFLFPSRFKARLHLSTRQYARIVKHWVSMIGLDPDLYGTHSMRRTKATLIYRKTKNIRAIQILLGHSKIESTVRYLGVEVDDALDISEHMEI